MTMPIIKKIYLHPVKHDTSVNAKKREKLFSKIVEESKETLELVDNPCNADFKVFFSEDLLKYEEAAVQELVKSQVKERSGLILDITEYPSQDELLLHPLLSLCTMCVGFITCTDDLVQEDVYMNTGRLAAIIQNPCEKENFKKPSPKNKNKNIKKPNILWFGTPDEIFQIRSEQVKNKHHNIETLSIDKNFNDKEKFESVVENADIIYLPKAYDSDGEEVRKHKTTFSIKEGKFVITPFLDLGFNGTLKEGIEFFRKSNIENWISMKQNELLNEQGIFKSKEQLLDAVKRAENEDYTELFMSDFEDALEEIEELSCFIDYEDEEDMSLEDLV